MKLLLFVTIDVHTIFGELFKLYFLDTCHSKVKLYLECVINVPLKQKKSNLNLTANIY